MNRKWLRRLIGGLSFTTALFVFQACYGPPQDLEDDLLIEGQVKSKNTKLPIEGIKVSVANGIQYQLTDINGRFSFYTEKNNYLEVMFEDIDTTKNGWFTDKDTVLSNPINSVYLNIELEEK